MRLRKLGRWTKLHSLLKEPEPALTKFTINERRCLHPRRWGRLRNGRDCAAGKQLPEYRATVKASEIVPTNLEQL